MHDSYTESSGLISAVDFSIHLTFYRRKNMGRGIKSNASGGTVYGLGFIGAAVYYISNATGFWMGVLGFLKAIVWPAFLVYEAFKHFGI